MLEILFLSKFSVGPSLNISENSYNLNKSMVSIESSDHLIELMLILSLPSLLILKPMQIK